MKTSVTDNTNYTKSCERFVKNDLYFKDFKRDPAYVQVLEHVTEKQGTEYLKYINIELLEYIERFKENDVYGNPKKFNYGEIGYISPTTLRYIKVLSDLINTFDNLKDIHILEIGGGYGGQSKIITDFLNIKKYTIIDLPEALALTKKYLKKFDNKFDIYNFVSAYDFKKIESDLLISNYAFSECVKEEQNKYLELIINNSKNGYMTCNPFTDYVYTINEIVNRIDKNVKILDEKPKTANQNKILIW